MFFFFFVVVVVFVVVIIVVVVLPLPATLSDEVHPDDNPSTNSEQGMMSDSRAASGSWRRNGAARR